MNRHLTVMLHETQTKSIGMQLTDEGSCCSTGCIASHEKCGAQYMLARLAWGSCLHLVGTELAPR